MAKFLYLYTGGQMAETPEAQEQQMQAWTAGDSVVDMGSPLGAGTTVSNGGSTNGGTTRVGGYSVISADSLDDAATKAKGCPVLESGGTVEVYEALPM
jgi:hypothetical protein